MLWLGAFIVAAGFLGAAGVILGIKARHGGRGVRPWFLGLIGCYVLVFAGFVGLYLMTGG